MKIRSGLKTLDQILGGGFEKTHNVAIVGGIDNDHVLLLHQLVMSFLSQGYKILLIEFRQDVNSLIKWLEPYGMNYTKFIKEGKLKILDGFSNLYSPTHVAGANILPNPMDLSITTAIVRESVVKEAYDFVVIDDLTSLYTLQTDQRAYIRVVVRLVNSIKRFGASTLASLNSDVLSTQDLSMLLIPFEYVLEAKNGTITIRRSFLPLKINQTSIPYIRGNTGIMLAQDSFKSVDKVKESLILDNTGALIMGGVRVQIIEEYSESALIEFIYQFLGPERGKEFLYRWGKYEMTTLPLDQDTIKNLPRIEAIKRILEDSFEFTKATGGGLLRILDLSEDRIVIEGKNLFPSLRNFPYPAHLNYVGALTKLIERLTGEIWEGEEVECESQGHRRCLFVIKRLSKGSIKGNLEDSKK
ncbi:ATPase domain-containing protein [Pyrococcus kukulkanii]|uniref:ATPase domain-containing protein n=1 Tax=Pyrococcus kukulkanii TaxID=1609559 RepID=UPI0035646F0A